MHLRAGPTATEAAPASTRPRAFFVAAFAIAGVLELAAASLSTRVLTIPLSAQFGVFQLLPKPYWIGMGLLAAAVVLSLTMRSDALVVATGALLLAALAGTPSLVEPYPRYWDSYLHFSLAQGIQATGHLPASNLGQYSANWPGTFLVDAMFSTTAGVPAMSFLTIYPFVVGGLTFVAIFAFLRSTFPPSVAAPGAVLSALFAVWAQFHLSPQSLGFILLLLILSVVWRRQTRWRTVSAVLFVGLVVSHPTSTLILLGILLAICVVGLLAGVKSFAVGLLLPRRPKESEEDRARRKEASRFARRVTFAYATTWFVWLYFHATASSQAAETAIVGQIGHLINLPEHTLNLATARTVENLFTWAPKLRLASLGVFGLFGIVSLVILRRRPASRPLATFLVSALLGLALIGGADIVGFGGQYYDRCLLFFAVVAPAMCLTAFEKVRLPRIAHRGVILLLVFGSVAAASTAYYQESFNQITGQAIGVSDFFQHAGQPAEVHDGLFPEPVWTDAGGRTSIAHVTFAERWPTEWKDTFAPGTAYVEFDPTAALWYRQWLGVNIYTSYYADRANHSLIYDNGRGEVYLLRG